MEMNKLQISNIKIIKEMQSFHMDYNLNSTLDVSDSLGITANSTVQTLNNHCS